MLLVITEEEWETASSLVPNLRVVVFDEADRLLRTAREGGSRVETTKDRGAKGHGGGRGGIGQSPSSPSGEETKVGHGASDPYGAATTRPADTVPIHLAGDMRVRQLTGMFDTRTLPSIDP